jgi:DinB superfamily
MAKKNSRSSRPARTPGKKKVSKRPKPKSPAGKPKPGAKASTALRDRSIELAKFAKKMILDMCEGIPDERACAQAGAIPNHKLWILGHLGRTADWAAGMIDGKPSKQPASWEGLFGGGSQPTSDASKYPPISEIRAAYEAGWDRLFAAARTMNDAQLLTPTTKDSGGFLNDKLDAILKCAWHEAWHLGQASLLRKALGIKPLMG